MRKIINFILVLLIIWVALLYPFRLAWFEGVLQIPEDLHDVFLLFLFFGYLICSSGMGLLLGKMCFKRKEE
ncbi:hypothetical protein [Paenibacillus xylanilyticus]|uniref:Uncharacterized protein n=1 Tax=Paenibacillus xylanilyticus TaxID=248903 RepID=A0A7Y6C0A6_9BACL|nr:hypothetical protein [Paenibacillus xylanilyticus]NUU77778.1 hypothetical protein [Paenibacillus xylanilyticus]